MNVRFRACYAVDTGWGGDETFFASSSSFDFETWHLFRFNQTIVQISSPFFVMALLEISVNKNKEVYVLIELCIKKEL